MERWVLAAVAVLLVGGLVVAVAASSSGRYRGDYEVILSPRPARVAGDLVFQVGDAVLYAYGYCNGSYERVRLGEYTWSRVEAVIDGSYPGSGTVRALYYRDGTAYVKWWAPSAVSLYVNGRRVSINLSSVCGGRFKVDSFYLYMRYARPVKVYTEVSTPGPGSEKVELRDLNRGVSRTIITDDPVVVVINGPVGENASIDAGEYYLLATADSNGVLIAVMGDAGFGEGG